MKFGVVVGNPPFQRNLHLQIINSIIPHITGEGCFIHPARWYEDPLAEYKKNSDKNKFRSLVDRLDDVKIMDIKRVCEEFNITFNGELMISTIKPEKTGKDIRLYNDVAQKCIDVILAYSKEHNLAIVEDKNQRDGWRAEIKAEINPNPHIRCMTEYSRKCQSNLFAMNKVNVFHNGYADGVEWMKTRRQTQGKKTSGDPFPDSIKFRSEKEAINFEMSCNTNFYNNILHLLKPGGRNTPLNYLPWMEDYTHPWSDEDYCRFFAKYGLDRECQKWMCRDVFDYRVKDYLKEEYTLS